MPYAAIRDLHLYYELHGPNDGPPIVLLNGAFDVVGERGIWDTKSRPLSRQATTSYLRTSRAWPHRQPTRPV